MDGTDRPPVATFFCTESLTSGAVVTLPEEAAHHMRVARIPVGERISLRNGAGTTAHGRLVKISRESALVDVIDTREVARPPEIHLLAPVADRERMLWLVEKATELGISSWRPVIWRRSKSVSPRGEGPAFQAKVRARMISALIQSGGAWLPDLFPEAPIERAVSAAPNGTRLILSKDGTSVTNVEIRDPVSIALGPEGGMEVAEHDAFLAGGFQAVSLARGTLRFETAGIAAIAIAAAQLSTVVSQDAQA